MKKNFLIPLFIFFSSLIVFGQKESKNADFEWLIKPRFKELRNFSHGLAAFRYNVKWGYINKKGKIVIPAQYEKAGNFSQKGYGGKEIDAWVVQNGEKFLIDRKGKRVGTNYDYKVMKMVADDRKRTSEGMIGFQRGELWGFMDKRGKVMVEPLYEDIKPYTRGIARVKKEGKWGVIDRKGKTIANFEYEHLSYFYGGYARAKKDDKWGFIDFAGEVAVDIKYDDLKPLSSGLALFKKEDKWGYINRYGATRIPAKFDLANNFSEELAQVKVGDKCGFINKKGEFVIRPAFDYGTFMYSFREGACPVQYHGKWGIIKHPNYVKKKKDDKKPKKRK